MKKEQISTYISGIFISLVTVVIIFSILEFLSRHFLPEKRSNFELQYNIDNARTFKPYVMFGGKPNANYTKNEKFNRYGYRGEAPTNTKLPDEKRIFILGGSTVFSGSPSIPEIIEGLFYKNGKTNVKVFNWGVLASVSSMEVARLVFEIATLQPDLVVMYNGGNDILHPFFYDARPGYPFNFLLFDNHPLIKKEDYQYPYFTLLLHESKFLRYFFNKYFINKLSFTKKIREESLWLSPSWQNDISVTYFNNLMNANLISNAYGAKFMAFFQPLVYFKKHLTPYEKKQCNLIIGYKEHARMTQEIFINHLEETKKMAKIDIINLSNMFSDEKNEVFTDHIHIKQEYKFIVAEKIFSHIKNFENL